MTRTVNLNLRCLILPDDDPSVHVFLINIHSDREVDELKDAIKLKRSNRLKNFDAADLLLWKCSIPRDENLKATLSSLRLDRTDDHGPTFLSVDEQLSLYFQDDAIPTKNIQILVQLPDHGEYLPLNALFDDRSANGTRRPIDMRYPTLDQSR